jgi:hypothetical protein
MKYKLFLLFFFFALASTTLLAQSLSDIGKVKIDMLSDAQLQEMLQRAKDQGLNESQVVSMARERGMSAVELGKLQQRLVNLKQGVSQGATTQTSATEGRTVESTQTTLSG